MTDSRTPQVDAVPSSRPPEPPNVNKVGQDTKFPPGEYGPDEVPTPEGAVSIVREGDADDNIEFANGSNPDAATYSYGSRPGADRGQISGGGGRRSGPPGP